MPYYASKLEVPRLRDGIRAGTAQPAEADDRKPQPPHLCTLARPAVPHPGSTNDRLITGLVANKQGNGVDSA